MVDIRHVLCAVDFSECSRRALDHAIAVATWYGAWLSVLHVHPVSRPPLTPFAADTLSPADRAALIAQLRAFVPGHVRSHIPAEFLVVEGNVAEEIVAEAAHADLVVLGTHGRSGIEQVVLGSVAEKVVRKAGCAVLTVPRGTPDATNAVPDLFHRIVAGVDGSDASLDALNYAVSLAEEADAHLTVLRVVDVPPELAEWASESAEGQGYAERWTASVLRRLHGLVPTSARRYCHVDERVGSGHPSQEILRLTAEQHAGLIVIGAQGHGALGRVLFGSTAQDVVRHAACPVLTLRRRHRRPAELSEISQSAPIEPADGVSAGRRAPLNRTGGGQ
jgi:nucleotide-binding universal stress UspA family protein